MAAPADDDHAEAWWNRASQGALMTWDVVETAAMLAVLRLDDGVNSGSLAQLTGQRLGLEEKDIKELVRRVEMGVVRAAEALRRWAS